MRKPKTLWQSFCRLSQCAALGFLTLSLPLAPAHAQGAKPQQKTKKSKDSLDAFEAKLKAAVKAGKLTEAQAKAKLDAFLKKQKAAKGKKDTLAELGKKLKAAVKAGKMTEAEAKAKWKEIIKKHKSSSKKSAKDKKKK